MTTPENCECCIGGQRAGMYDTGRPAVCAGCSHLVSEHRPSDTHPLRKPAASALEAS